MKKTKKMRDNSELNLDKFLTEPCEIDEELYWYIADATGASYQND